MKTLSKTRDDRRRLRMSLAVLCIAIGGLGAVPGAALANPPSNDDVASAHDLGGGSTASASGTNLDATAEPGEPDHNGFTARASVWYRWTAPEDGSVKIDTCGSDFDTVLAVYEGSGIDALTSLASNDDSSCGLQSRVRFNAAPGTTYLIAVDGYGGQEGAIERA
jgi:Bacterial pre-peptidase C-terminal domain